MTGAFWDEMAARAAFCAGPHAPFDELQNVPVSWDPSPGIDRMLAKVAAFGRKHGLFLRATVQHKDGHASFLALRAAVEDGESIFGEVLSDTERATLGKRLATLAAANGDRRQPSFFPGAEHWPQPMTLGEWERAAIEWQKEQKEKHYAR